MKDSGIIEEIIKNLENVHWKIRDGKERKNLKDRVIKI